MASRIWGATAVVLALASVPACNTSQPTSTGAQTVSITFDARANNDKWNCWDMNGSTVYCEQDTASGLVSRPVPWGYDVEISLIPKGETTETIVASSVDGVDVPSAFPVFGNMTDYDPQTEPGPVCPLVMPTNCTAVYTNPRKVSRGSRDYAEAKNLPLPEPNTLNRTENVYSFSAHKGDTVIVRARKALLSQWPQTVQPITTAANLILEGGISVGGRSADASGTVVSSFDDGAGLSFSYTLR